MHIINAKLQTKTVLKSAPAIESALVLLLGDDVAVYRKDRY